MDRQLKSRVLTAADIMTAYTNLAFDLRSLKNSVGEVSTETHAAFVAGQLVGAERLMREEFKLLVETESGYRCSNCGFEMDDVGSCPNCGSRTE